MPNLVGVKSSFAAGELAPSLRSRVDLNLYSKGATKLKNMIVHAHGGASNRAGTHHIAECGLSAKKARVIPFEFSTTQTYMLEFGEYYIRFFSNGAAILDNNSFDNYTKLMMHCDASPFTDETGKTITDTIQYDTYTKLLIHFDGTDAATTYTAETGQTVTFVGTAQLDTAQKVFGTASLLLDGDSDYLTLLDSADWDFGTGDFTIDFWARFANTPENGVPVSKFTTPNGYLVIVHNLTSIGFYPESAYAAWDATGLSMAINTWYHMAFIRSGNNFYIFLDGIKVGTFDATGKNITGGTGSALEIGGYDSGATGLFNGWIDELRISKGIARWTANFTVPSNPYGTFALDTGTKKFGAGSANSAGGGAYLSLVDSADWSFGANNFSVDFQIDFVNLEKAQGLISQYQDANNYWVLYKQADNKLAMVFKYASSIVGHYYTTTAPSISAGTFYHLEFTRSGGNAYIFVDGVSQPLTAATPFGSADVGDITGVIKIGYDEVNVASLYGNIDELRVSKGVARHTEDFTAPTVAYAAGTIYEVATPYAEDDLEDLYYTQSADVLYLCHPDYAPRQLERNSNTDWDLNTYAPTGGPFMVDNIDETMTVAVSATSGNDKTLTAAGFTFNTLHVGALWKLRHYIEGQAVTVALGSVTASTSISCGGTWRIITHGTWTGTIRIEKSTNSGSTWTNLREFSSADDYNADSYGTEDMSDYAEPFLVRVNMTARASGTCNANLTTDAYYHEGIVKITAVAIGGATATVDTQRNSGSTATTIEWSEGSWSDYRGFPAVVEFHPEDRLMFANTYYEPYTYWFTKSGNYSNFSRSDPLSDADGISSPVPGRKVNGINGLVPLSEMIALTLSNEISIRSASGSITPTSIYNKIHGWEGSYGVRPLIIGNRAVYVQSTGSIIRDLQYSLNEESFTGLDRSIMSSHLFNGYTIKELAYQQNPDRLVWAVRSDGKLLSMTYMPEQEVIAWTWHDTYSGTDLFESVACIRGDGFDEVWFIVNRGGVRYVERMVQRQASLTPADQFFVDCGTTYSTGQLSAITDLSRFEGRKVAILADGNVLAQQTVTGSTISLGATYATIQVGLAYTSDVETLNIDANLTDGTTQGRKIKVGKLVLRFLNSRGGELGPDENSLYDIQHPTNSTSLALFSDDTPVKETMSGGYTDGGRIFIRQSDPLPLTILAVIPTVNVGGITST